MSQDDFVLTNHAKERMKLRHITTAMISQALADPQRTQVDSEGGMKYIRRTNGRELHVAAFYNPDQKKWIIKSTWVRGEHDIKQIAFVPFVLTNYVKERMRLRSITASMISYALADPHRTQIMSDGNTKYIRFTNRRELHVVAFYNPDQKKWVVKAAWVQGEHDSQLYALWLKLKDWLQNN